MKGGGVCDKLFLFVSIKVYDFRITGNGTLKEKKTQWFGDKISGSTRKTKIIILIIHHSVHQTIISPLLQIVISDLCIIINQL